MGEATPPGPGPKSTSPGASVLVDSAACPAALQETATERTSNVVCIALDTSGFGESRLDRLARRMYTVCMTAVWDPRNGGSLKKEYDFSQGKRGPVLRPKGKTRITIYLDDDILDAFRERADRAGSGYQTMINQALREYLAESATPLDEKTLRKVLREELRATG